MVAVGINETRKLFNRPKVLNVLADWWDGLLRGPQQSVTVAVRAQDAVASIGVLSVTALASVIPGSDASVDERIRLLACSQERTIGEVASLQRRVAADADERKLSDDALRTGITQGLQKLMDLVRHMKVDRLHLEVVGVVWLAGGLVLTTFSAEIAAFCDKSGALFL